MIKVGLREANMHFSKYVKLVRQGQEVVVTERGAPIAVIKPLAREARPEQRIRILEEQGVLKRPTRGTLPSGAPVAIKGRPIAETVTDEREERP
jgi:prevent-host-death family protein